MKKFFKSLAVATTFVLLSANSYAKTEGNYVGVSLNNFNVEQIVEDQARSKFKYDTSLRDINFSYKYAFNFYDFIVAPELNLGAGLASDLKTNYSAKLNLGYDLSENFALFGTVGFNYNKSKFLNKKKAPIFGLAAKYQLDEHFNLNASVDYRQKGTRTEISSFGVSYNF